MEASRDGMRNFNLQLQQVSRQATICEGTDIVGLEVVVMLLCAKFNGGAMVWEIRARIALKPALCKSFKPERLVVKMILEVGTLAICLRRIKPIPKPVQVFQPMVAGILEVRSTILPRRMQATKKLLKLGWKWKEEGLSSPTSEEVLFSFLFNVMNYIIWNSKGALKPNFQSHVSDLARVHDLAIFVTMETCLGGERAKDITDSLPSMVQFTRIRLV